MTSRLSGGSALQALESDATDASAPEYASILQLMEAVDSYIPEPERPRDQSFLMPIEDVFGIKGRGTVVTGRVERGVMKVGEEVEIVGFGEQRKTVVTGIEMFHKTVDETEPGDAVGLLLRGIERDDVERGQVVSLPSSITPQYTGGGAGVCSDARRGRASHPVLRWL